MAHRVGPQGVPVHHVLLLAWDLPVGTPAQCLSRSVHGDTGLAPQVRDWTEDESSNQGLLVTVQSPGGGPLDPPPLQFASGRGHHESKKPMLVLFTDDGRRGASLPTAGFPGGSHTSGTTPSVPTSLLRRCSPHVGSSNPNLLPCCWERLFPFWYSLVKGCCLLADVKLDLSLAVGLRLSLPVGSVSAADRL